jgi:hypothetical protein
LRRTIIVVDETSTGDQPAGPAPLTPRQVRARRRRRRRVIGVVVFLLVALGILGVAYLAVAGPGDDSDRADSASSSTSPTTTTVVKPAGPYRVTTGVNVRQGPGTNFPTVGTIETGHMVFASCVIEGAPVQGPSGPVTKWLHLTGFGPVGYLTVAYVDTGDDLNVAGKIPACAA